MLRLCRGSLDTSKRLINLQMLRLYRGFLDASKRLINLQMLPTNVAPLPRLFGYF